MVSKAAIKRRIKARAGRAVQGTGENVAALALTQDDLRDWDRALTLLHKWSSPATCPRCGADLDGRDLAEARRILADLRGKVGGPGATLWFQR